MKMKILASTLTEAFSVVGCVTPKPLTENGIPGYLMKLDEGKLKIYSMDTQTVAVTVVDVPDTESEDGSLVYPSANVSALKFLGDQEITLCGSQEDGSFSVSYTTDTGVSSKKVSIDPDYFITPDEEIASAESADEFFGPVLHHILSCVRPFFADPKDSRAEDHLKTVQTFSEGVGDGYTFAATGTTACSAFCDAHTGKTLAVHGQHVPSLLEFLSKVTGPVKVKHSSNMELVESEDGKVFGFTRNHKSHPTFKLYGLEHDSFVFRIPKKLFSDALGYAKAETSAKDGKVRLVYARNNGKPTVKINFEGAKSQMETFSVAVAPVEEDGKLKLGDRDWSLGVNPDFLAKLMFGVSHEVEMRVSLVEQRGKVMGMIRTREEYRVDDLGKVSAQGQHTCKVFRWAASKELRFKDSVKLYRSGVLSVPLWPSSVARWSLRQKG